MKDFFPSRPLNPATRSTIEILADRGFSIAWRFNRHGSARFTVTCDPRGFALPARELNALQLSTRYASYL